MSSYLKIEQDPLLLSDMPSSPGSRHSSVSVGRTGVRPKQHSTRRATSIAVVPTVVPLLPAPKPRASADDVPTHSYSSPMKRPRVTASEESSKEKQSKGRRWTLSPMRRTISQTSFCGSDDPLADDAEDMLIIQCQDKVQEAYWKDREPDLSDEEKVMHEGKRSDDVDENEDGEKVGEKSQAKNKLYERKLTESVLKEEEDDLVEKRICSVEEKRVTLDEELERMIEFKVQTLLEEVMAGLRDELHERIVANLFVGMSVDTAMVHAFLAPQLKKLRSNIVHAVLMRSADGKEEKEREDEPPHIAFVLDRIGTLMDNLTRSIKEGYVTRLLAAWPPTLDRIRAERTAREIVEVNEWSPGIDKLVRLCVERALEEERRRG